MANSATLVDVIPDRRTGLNPILEYEVVIDTEDTDYAIPFADALRANERVYVVGWKYTDSAANNLTFKSGASKSQTHELAANQGMTGAVDEDTFYFATKPGEALIIRASAVITAAVGKNLILYLERKTQILDQ